MFQDDTQILRSHQEANLRPRAVLSGQFALGRQASILSSVGYTQLTGGRTMRLSLKGSQFFKIPSSNYQRQFRRQNIFDAIRALTITANVWYMEPVLQHLHLRSFVHNRHQQRSGYYQNSIRQRRTFNTGEKLHFWRSKGLGHLRVLSQWKFTKKGAVTSNKQCNTLLTCVRSVEIVQGNSDRQLKNDFHCSPGSTLF